MEMIKLPISFIKKNEFHKKNVNFFGWNITKMNDYFVDKNTLIEFPDIFKGVKIDLIEVKHDDVFKPDGEQWKDPKV